MTTYADRSLLPGAPEPDAERSEIGEYALDLASSRAFGIDFPISDLWNPDKCPAEFLSWLAWAVSVDEWSANWSVAVQRQVIKESLLIHQRKGTVWAVKQAVLNAGLASTVSFIEGFQPVTYNAVHTYNAEKSYNFQGNWAEFKIIMGIGPEDVISSITLLRRIIESVKPVRSKLIGLIYSFGYNESLETSEIVGQLAASPRFTDSVDLNESQAHNTSISMGSFGGKLVYEGRATYDGKAFYDTLEEIFEFIITQGGVPGATMREVY